MTTAVEKRAFDPTHWGFVAQTPAAAVAGPVAPRTRVEVLGYTALGGALLSLGAINTGWIATAAIPVMFPVLAVLAFTLALFAVHAIFTGRVTLAGAFGLISALGFAYILLGGTTLASVDATVAFGLGMGFVVWALIGAVVAFGLLPKHFFTAMGFVFVDAALWLIATSYLATETVAATTAGYFLVVAGGFALVTALAQVLWPHRRLVDS